MVRLEYKLQIDVLFNKIELSEIVEQLFCPLPGNKCTLSNLDKLGVTPFT